MSSSFPDPTPEQMSAVLPLLIERFKGEFYGDFAPWSCEMCPFNAKTREPYHQISNDLSEAHYLCPILDKEVWGENPECDDFNKEVVYKSLKFTQETLKDKELR